MTGFTHNDWYRFQALSKVLNAGFDSTRHADLIKVTSYKSIVLKFEPGFHGRKNIIIQPLLVLVISL